MIEVRCFGSLEEAALLRDEVNALNCVGVRPDPFLTFEFFENFLRNEEPVGPVTKQLGHLGAGLGCAARREERRVASHSSDSQQRSAPKSGGQMPKLFHNGPLPGQGLRLWFLMAFDAGQLIGYLALKHVTHTVLGMRASKVDFLVTHDADRPQLVARPEQAQAVSAAFLAYLWGRRREWSFLEFRQQDATSPLLPPPPAVKLKGCWVSQWPSMDNGTIPIHWDTLDAYFKSFSKKFRSNVSRQMRSLLAAGEVEYLVSSDPGTTPALFELYQSIEQRSWKSRAGAAIGRHSQWVKYFQGLLDARQPMRMSIHVLLLDGVPVAGLITGAFGQGLYALHIVSDTALNHLAPGSAVLLMSMRQAIEGRYTFFNLLSGFGYYKVRWQAQMTETHNAQIYRIGSAFFWRRVLGDLQRWIFSVKSKHAPTLFNPTRRDVSERESEPSNLGAGPNPQINAAELERIAALIAKARKGQGEFLSAEELAALMPFETQRVPEVKGNVARAIGA